MLENQDGLRRDAVEAFFRYGLRGELEERGQRCGALEPRPRCDHQQVDPRREGIRGVDDIGEADQVALDLMLVAAVQRLAQPGGRGRDQRVIGAERLLDRGRTRPLAAAGAALELSHRPAERKLFRKQVDGTPQAAIVAAGKAGHRLAERAPGRERRPPRDAGQETCRALPVPAIHGLDAALHRRRVAPQRVVGREALQRLPAAVDHRPVRHYPCGRG